MILAVRIFETTFETILYIAPFVSRARAELYIVGDVSDQLCKLRCFSQPRDSDPRRAIISDRYTVCARVLVVYLATVIFIL